MSDTDAYRIIVEKQRGLSTARYAMPPEHRPQMLYFGCIDARLDPIHDIGIEKGALLIFRNIAALVPKYARVDGRPAPEALSTGAALEFFLENIPPRPGLPKHIVVSGHTDCGGLKACRDEIDTHGHHLPLYLESLRGIRSKVMEEAKADGGWDADRVLHALEESSVRQSVANLMTYPAVNDALANGLVHIHGWVLNTATSGILELDSETGRFAPMSRKIP